MKGIILAGGSGTRLHPLTLGVSKQLLPIYDKPMIYYPLSVLMLAGIREVLIISTPNDISGFERLLGNGHDLGMEFSYKVQPSPDGLAQAFILGEEFIGGDSVCLVLGDNIFYGAGLKQLLMNAVETVDTENKAVIFGNYVHNAKRYGVVEFDENNNVKSIEEKPEEPKSNFAVVGLYFYPNSVINIAKQVKPSNRGELEITTVNQQYMQKDHLKLQIMSRGFAWLDTGTHESLTEATEFVKAVEHRTGLKIACLEEIAYAMKFISKEQLQKLASGTSKSSYQKYLQKIAE
ncbi:glucose-1-phosphate thymidylyltransferase RfbA [Cochleicola gelatinilyticus]|uniref:Glucose-1-phosphate thymidylyltransferase n=1 Tax=Cochleicola gelatinilyticus TaxID=1763537 RepID=A0A167G885_9FLAO|nr:glucose-1-phosphate thymidylyltransferase RfbA [Cochleicola gelatinilyticus]OAB77321.1 glucose-1-phosphate thymidylyltransferase [Cochleicola gelatinilyticus]